jgi:hypothetical protein
MTEIEKILADGVGGMWAPKNPQPMNGARLVTLIESTIARRGKGTERSPIRIITQYFSTDGELVAEVDQNVQVHLKKILDLVKAVLLANDGKSAEVHLIHAMKDVEERLEDICL